VEKMVADLDDDVAYKVLRGNAASLRASGARPDLSAFSAGRLRPLLHRCVLRLRRNVCPAPTGRPSRVGV
jgi:hypothetical protein